MRLYKRFNWLYRFTFVAWLTKRRLLVQINFSLLYHTLQGWPDVFFQGPNLNILFLVRASKLDILYSINIYRPFFLFCGHILCLLIEKSDIFEIFNTNLIFAMFLSNDKKVQGPQKQVGGPHFGHPCHRLLHKSSFVLS